MFAEEWPLMFFTLLSQFAIGSYIFFVIIRSLNKKFDREVSVKMTKFGMIFVGPIMFIALLLSVFHLGTPLGAYRAILNWDSSWLSREIIFAGLFFGLWVVGYILERKGNWSQALGWINSVVGVAAVFSMASIYNASILPSWSTLNTFLSFFGTTIVFGATGTVFSILLSKEEKSQQVISFLKITGLIGIIAIVFQLIYLPVYTSSLAGSGTAALDSVAAVSGDYLYPTLIRWILSISGLAILVYGLFRNVKSKSFYQFSIAALVLVLVGEILGRYLFYATGFPIIVG
jgi:anaerobic dimethyl sulfoxide reductase subunit C (anchor subunit)